MFFRKLFCIFMMMGFLYASYVIKPEVLVEIDVNDEELINERFSNLKNNIFKIIAKDIKNISIKKLESGLLVSSLTLYDQIDNINLIWLLPDEFSEFIDEKGNIYNAVNERLEGEFSVILRVVKNGLVIKEEAISTDFMINK